MSTSTNKSMADLLNFDFDFEDSFEPVNFDLCIWTQHQPQLLEGPGRDGRGESKLPSEGLPLLHPHP